MLFVGCAHGCFQLGCNHYVLDPLLRPLFDSSNNLGSHYPHFFHADVFRVEGNKIIKVIVGMQILMKNRRVVQPGAEFTEVQSKDFYFTPGLTLLY